MIFGSDIDITGSSKTEQIIIENELIDPVCGMSVTKDSDYYHSYKSLKIESNSVLSSNDKVS